MNARVGERLKDLLNLDESVTKTQRASAGAGQSSAADVLSCLCVSSSCRSTHVEYKAFKSAMQDNSSFRNAKAFTYAPAPAMQ
jgi:hypothetical protein